MANLSDRLRALRAEKRYEQKEVAAATDISYSSIQKYEGGTAVPREDKILALAKFFGVTAEYLKGESDDRGDGFEIHAHRDPTVPGIDLDQALGLVTQLEKLSKLHDDGKLTDEEYSILKSKIIRR